ncbi:hypothetical protein [Lentzea flava]|uniref:Uncharacterized protein n=1 Tax=Lentzea flava TaxID=103732 RepID=A0ABQ2V4S7_9PSEU|nr:hypothetical protein [Lentzea flava]MCP2203519.1 hypothetical protein [Lentzea flava]GGU68988.1 hypothetical protein GCM10010178_70930 [Lentzea flava]
MTTTPYTGAPHPRRKCSTSPTTSSVLLAVTAFVFTGWMLAQGHSPVVAVATTSAVLAVTTTLSRSRLFSARFGPLPPANPMVIWQDDER